MLRITLVFALLTTASALAAPAWEGQWISVPDADAPNTWIAYRKSVELDSVPETAHARIACDSKYWLWVNGKCAVFEGQLKRGPTPSSTYYDTVDLAPYLDQGTNTIAVLVWHFGKHGFSHNNSGKAGLVFDAQLGGTRVVSDGSWRARIHPAYGNTDKPHPNYRLPEANIHFDARSDMPGWEQPGYDDSAWPRAVALGHPPTEPWGPLEERPILQWRNSGLLDYAALREEPGGGGRKVVIGTLPYNAQVTPYLEVKAGAGSLIGIQTDDYLFTGTPSVRAEYVAREGTQAYESLAWMNGHEVRYTLPEGVEVLSLRYRETGYNADFAGTFSCDDPALNQLWEEARRTLYVTMRDNYMDCPERERAQWWGDAVNEIGEAFYVFDAEKGPMIARKAILELARWQREDKTIYSPVPSGVKRPGAPKRDGSYDSELPRQMLASVGWYGFWTYYWYTGDAETINRVYPHVRDYLSLWEMGDDGLCIHRPGGWDWTDWGKHKDVPVIENAWLYLALKAGVAMAELTGNTADVPAYERKMASIRQHFNPVFWQGDRYRSPGHKGETDDRAQAMAVVAGLADAAYYPAIRKVLEVEEHASPYMEKYVLEALYLMDAPEDAVARMKRRYASMLADPYSTLWENFGDGDKPGTGTYNHAWSGGPLTMMGQYAAGVAPASPNLGRFTVRPQMGPLNTIQTTVPTAHGDIAVHITRNAERFDLRLTVPEGTTAQVTPPDVYEGRITVARSGAAPQEAPNGRIPELPAGAYETAVMAK